MQSKSLKSTLSFDDLIHHHGSAKVLAVDDNQKNIQVIGQLLKNTNWCSLSVCLESEKAIKLASKIHPDIILLDLHMPNLNGIEVLKELNKKDILKTSTVLFLTADREIENRLEGLSLGCADYIQKPFNSEEFIIKLKYHIKMRLYEKEILNTLKNTKNILDNINQAIFSINKSGEIINPISKHSNEIFGPIVKPGHKIEGFLKDKFQFSQTEISSIVNKLLDSFKESKIHWTKIQNTLPTKYLFHANEGQEKVLKIKYSSVWNDQTLENIIFYFYDITDKEQKEDDVTKYSLSQISSLSGINLETLRSWTKRFNIKGKFYNTESKFRFSGKELKIFQLYKSLIEKGENIGSLVKLNYEELIGRKKSLTEEKNKLYKENQSNIRSSDLIKTLLFFIDQSKFDLFQRDFNKLNKIYNQRELVFDIILPFLKLSSEDKKWNKMSTSKKDFFYHFLVKKINEFAVPKNTIPKNENQKIYFLDVFPSNKSLHSPMMLLLSSYHNLESYFINEDILHDSFQDILKDEHGSIIFLSLNKKGAFDETEFNLFKKDIESSNTLKRHNVFLFNNHPTIKIDSQKDSQFNLINSFEEFEQVLVEITTEMSKTKSAA